MPWARSSDLNHSRGQGSQLWWPQLHSSVRGQRSYWWLERIWYDSGFSFAVMFLRTKPIDMSCSKKWKPVQNLWHLASKTAQTRSHKSKFCPCPKSSKTLKLPQLTMDVSAKIRDFSKLQIHSNLNLTTLCTAFRIFHCDCRSLSIELSITTQLIVRQRSRRGNLWYMPLETIFMASDPNL